MKAGDSYCESDDRFTVLLDGSTPPPPHAAIQLARLVPDDPVRGTSIAKVTLRFASAVDPTYTKGATTFTPVARPAVAELLTQERQLAQRLAAKLIRRARRRR